MAERVVEIDGPFVDEQPVPTFPADPDERPPETAPNESVEQLPDPDDSSEV